MIYIKKGSSSGVGEWSPDGNGISTTQTLNDATGDEFAAQINYTTNKATSGNDTGLVINHTDTLSPGTSSFFDLQLGGVSKFRVRNDGKLVAVAGIVDTVGITTPSISTTGTNSFGTFTHNNTQSLSERYSVKITGAIAQTGSAGHTSLLIDKTDTEGGSGEHNLFDAQIGSVSKFKVDNAGLVDFAGASYTGGDPTTTGYFVVQVGGTSYKIPVEAV